MATERPDFLYPKVPDVELRISLRTGEAIVTAAVMMGIDLVLRREDKGDEWLDLRFERVMERLMIHDQQTARRVLKEARRSINNRSLNGDRRDVLNKISEGMRIIGKPQEISQLPPIPPRPVEKLTVK